ncbi:caspase family protein, partial [Betaproteobacteria bacterium PRO7]|nr:caspase family protein [Betaproteobacteria bacterium PRO7]
TAVLYYSGHGVLNQEDKSYYFLPYDLRAPIVDSLLRAEDMAAEIELVRPRRLLVILDCCHAGGMGIKGDGAFMGTGLARSAAPAEARSVVALMRGQGRAVLSSSTAAESSYVRSDRRMSIFTYHLVESLTGHAQPEGATDVLVSDVMSYVSRQVPRSAREEYNVSQTPVYQVSGENFPVALLMGGRGISKGRPLPDPFVAPAAGPTVNTGGGAYVGGNITAAGDVNLGAKSVGGDEIRGSKYVMSGNFQGAVLNIESHLSNVTQAIVAAPGLNHTALSTFFAPTMVPGTLAAAWRFSPSKNAAGRASSSVAERLATMRSTSSRVATNFGSSLAAKLDGATCAGSVVSGSPAACHAFTPPFRIAGWRTPIAFSVQ